MAMISDGKKPRTVPRKVKQALGLFIAGEVTTITDAAAAVGLSREHVSRSLSQPHVAEWYDGQVRRSLARATGRAATRLTALIDAKSEHVSLDASTEVLAIAGIRPPDRTSPLVNINVQPGYVVKLKHAVNDDDVPGGPVIDHEPMIVGRAR